MTLLLKHWKWALAAAILSAFVVTTCTHGRREYKRGYAEMHAVYLTDIQERETAQRLALEQRKEEDEAQKQRAKDQKDKDLHALQLTTDKLRTTIGVLQSELAEAGNRIATADREAVAEYAATATVVFEHCTREYSALAGNADGHAIDVREQLNAP